MCAGRERQVKEASYCEVSLLKSQAVTIDYRGDQVCNISEYL